MRRLLLCSLIVLTSCLKVGPNFEPPEVPIPCAWNEIDDSHLSSDQSELFDWWRQFNDPCLENLIQLALAQNLPLKAAAFRILEARAALGIAIGEWFPQTQDLEGSAFRFGVGQNTPNSFALDRYYTTYNLGLRVGWELDFWGRFRRGIESAASELDAQINDFQDVAVLLLADVASTYILIRTLEERVAILKNNVAIQTRSLEIVQARWNAGMVTELDLQQARTLLFGTESRLPVLEIALSQTKHALGLLLAITPTEIDAALCEGTGKIPEAPFSIGVGVPAELLCQRPDVSQALNAAAAQSARIGIAKADLFPAFSLTGLIGFQSGSSSSRSRSRSGGVFISGKSISYFFGPEFRWPLLNYGRLINRVRLERARFYQLLVEYENTLLRAYQEVEDGIVAFIGSHDEVDALEKSSTAAARAVSLARTQYVEGIADYTRVLNTEEALLEEEERLAIARGNIAQGLIATYRALGGGWQCLTRISE